MNKTQNKRKGKDLDFNFRILIILARRKDNIGKFRCLNGVQNEINVGCIHEERLILREEFLYIMGLRTL